MAKGSLTLTRPSLIHYVTSREGLQQRAGDVFSMDQIESYLELKWTEVYRFEHTPHPVEFEMYYSI